MQLHTPKSDIFRGLQRPPSIPVGWRTDLAWCPRTHLMGQMVVFPGKLVKGGCIPPPSFSITRDRLGAPTWVAMARVAPCCTENTRGHTGLPTATVASVSALEERQKRASGNVVRRELCCLLPKQR